VQQANQAVFVQPFTQMMPFGPVLDVLPVVNADGYTIQMTILPTVTEFIGYDDPGPFVPQAITGGGISVTSVLPLPHLRVRQVTTTCIVWDGQTVVLGGLLSESVQKVRDKVPIIGDLPLVGRLFRNESDIQQKKNLMVFVTPTIIDPAGNRVHREEDLPFAQSGVPAQPKAEAGK
jgi:general secretion pathway protein D